MRTKKETIDPRLEALVEDWDEAKISAFQRDLLTWYEQERRLLPWRETKNPYNIWVSEIMLQQTQVVTVIPYYHRFMEWFPTIADLAAAPEAKLLKAWEGLGYYSRVRNMQVAAQQIVADYAGEMPKTIKELLTLKGIGPYTAGAIGSIAFGLPEPAIDGNVMRVFSRLFCIEDDIAKPASRKTFDFVVRKVISHEDPGSFNQAIMDIGATICTPTNPNYEINPIRDYCKAYQEGTVLNYPVKSKQVKSRPVYYIAQVIKNQHGEFLMTQRESKGLLANLWTFPLVEVTKEDYQELETSWQGNQKKSEPQLSLDLVAEDMVSLTDWLKTENQDEQIAWQTQPLGEITHVFSHLRWHVLLTFGIVKVEAELKLKANERWVRVADFASYPVPKPQQKMVALLQSKDYL